MNLTAKITKITKTLLLCALCVLCGKSAFAAGNTRLTNPFAVQTGSNCYTVSIAGTGTNTTVTVDWFQNFLQVTGSGNLIATGSSSYLLSGTNVYPINSGTTSVALASGTTTFTSGTNAVALTGTSFPFVTGTGIGLVSTNGAVSLVAVATGQTLYGSGAPVPGAAVTGTVPAAAVSGSAGQSTSAGFTVRTGTSSMVVTVSGTGSAAEMLIGSGGFYVNGQGGIYALSPSVLDGGGITTDGYGVMTMQGITDTGNVPSIDPNNRLLYDQYNWPSINWASDSQSDHSSILKVDEDYGWVTVQNSILYGDSGGSHAWFIWENGAVSFDGNAINSNGSGTLSVTSLYAGSQINSDDFEGNGDNLEFGSNMETFIHGSEEDPLFNSWYNGGDANLNSLGINGGPFVSSGALYFPNGDVGLLADSYGDIYYSNGYGTLADNNGTIYYSDSWGILVDSNGNIRYSNDNGTLVDSGGNIRYSRNNGILADDNGAIYYTTGGMFTDGDSIFYPDVHSSTLADSNGQLYYGYGNGRLTDNTGDLYYSSGITLAEYNVLFYPNNMELADNLGNLYAGNGSVLADANGLIYPAQAVTISAPAYVQGSIYFDTTLNKLRVGATSNWETITSGELTGKLSTTGTATTAFTVSLSGTMNNTSYKAFVTPTTATAASPWYVSAKTTTTFTVTYLSGVTGAISFDWKVSP